MKIRFHDGEVVEVTSIEKSRPTIVNGRYVAINGVFTEGVEDITEYDADGLEIIPEVQDED